MTPVPSNLGEIPPDQRHQIIGERHRIPIRIHWLATDSFNIHSLY